MRLDTRLVRALVAIVVSLAVLVGLSLVAGALAPTAVASGAELDAQRGAAERAIQRVYAAGIDQLKTTRSLRLAITDAQAGAIEQKYADQLKALRRSALQAIGGAYGQSADQSAQYAAQSEPRLDALVPAASSTPVLLAPRLYAIVERMGQLTSQLTDQGIKEMTQTAPSSPGPSPSPSSTPRPPGPASPSPTGR